MSKNIYNPNSHFFVDYTKLADPISSNYINDAFGPVKNSIEFTTATNEYRTTSFVRAINPTENVKVFAICDGEVLIIQQTGVGNEDKINIILKPSQSYSPLKIKYFIYRGINKAALFNNELHLNKIIEDEPDNPVLLKNIWTSYLNYNQPEYLKNGGTIENTDKVIYINQLTCPNNTPDDTLIENIFKRNINNADYQLTNCKKGTVLGTFAEKIGLDIVLDDGDYILEHEEQFFKLDLGYARKVEHKFDIAQFQNNAGKIKKYKEHIHSFLDAAAFWGSHIDTGEISSTPILNNPKDTNTIYTNIIQRFQTANTIYLYIKGERNRSINFYDHTPNPFKVNFNKKTSVENFIDYSLNDWPILVRNIIQPQINNVSPVNFLQFSIDYFVSPNISESDVNVNMYMIIPGYLNDSFVTSEFLVKKNTNNLIDRSAKTNKIEDINFNNVLVTKKNTNNIDETKNYSISTFIFVNYNGNQLLKYKNYFNNLWKPNFSFNDIDSTNSDFTISRTYIDNKVVDLSPRIEMKNTVLQHKVILDNGKNLAGIRKKRRLYISSICDAYIDKNNDRPQLICKSVFSGTKDKPLSTSNYSSFLYNEDDFKTKENNVSVYRGLISDGSLTFKSLSLISETDFEFENKYFQLGITEEEYNTLFFNNPVNTTISYLPSNSTNIYFHLEEVMLMNGSNVDYSKEYRKYKLGLVFENQNGEINMQNLDFPMVNEHLESPLFPTNDVFVYTIDEKFFHSIEYSEYQEHYKEFANAIVEFRTKEINNGYNGEFGFDWLRVGDNGDIPYESSIDSGFESHSLEDISNTEFDSQKKAFRFLKKEYGRIPLTSENSFYYIPWLNIFSYNQLNNNYPNTIELRILIEIKNQNLQKLELEYDNEVFQIDKTILDDTQITSKIQSINKTIIIKCLKDFSENKQIKVFAFPLGATNKSEAKIAGRINILKRPQNIAKIIPIVIIPVLTKVGQSIFKGKIENSEIETLKNIIYQTGNIANIQVSTILNLSNNSKYTVTGNTPNSLVYGKFRYKKLATDRNIIVNKGLDYFINNNELYNDLKTIFFQNPTNNKYRNFFTVFVFGELSKSINLLGRVKKIGTKNVCLFKPNNSNRVRKVLAHEVLHGLNLLHTHQEIIEYDFNNKIPITNENVKFTFPHAQNSDILLSVKSTNNIMSYNSSSLPLYTWKWQWEIVSENIF